MQTTDVLVVGAGFAGAATAHHLALGSELRVSICEAEKVPGAHASGRNAALVLQSVEDPAVRAAAAASVAWYRERCDAVGFDVCGSLLLGDAESLHGVREPSRVPSRLLTPAEARHRVPLLAGHDFAGALLTPGDGVMDVSRLLGVYLDGARRRGATVETDRRVLAIEGSGPFRVATTKGQLEAGAVVDAAGGWAPQVGSLVHGATAPPMVPWKRHLFVLDGVATGPGEPFVWSLDREFYFRGESGGLLVSICDEQRSSSLEETVSAGIDDRLAERLLAEIPRLEAATRRRVWSCFRTKAPDGRFVIGPDPAVPDLHWVAALGGHGMGCSWEVGRLGAASVLAGAAEPAFAPARFR